MSVAADREELNEVTVLVGFLKMIVGSNTLPSATVTKLEKDIDAIPARFAKVKAADRVSKRTWKKRRVT